MPLRKFIGSSLLVCILSATAAGQENSNTPAQSSSLTITAAAAAGERVRITAPAAIVQMHLEVYAASGEKLFDQEIRGGNVFDWHLQDGQGHRVAPGSYVCVVTAKSVSGKLTQKLGTVNVEEKSASVQAATSQHLSVLQAQAIGPVEENSSWKTSGADEPQTPTVIAHDGTDGQMIRGRGALTFRIGNFFTGNDREQMRMTEDGRLGIGTKDPQATLDVAGTIRAQRFLIVKPKSDEAGKSAQDFLTSSNATEPEEVLITGTGTQNRIAKWIDNSGTLGDSAITETGGDVGIGTEDPAQKLHITGPDSRLRIQSTLGGAYTEIKFHADGRIWNTGVGGSTVTSPVSGKYYIYDETAGQFRLAIDTDGRVGIGTPSPDQKLSVNGDASKTGSGSWLAFSDQRLKKIRGNFTPGLRAVMQLQPLRYEYKRDNALNLKSGREYVGFSAQSVERVIPEAVSKNDQGYLLVNNDPILWTMLNAIKEQQAQIQEQQKQIDELKKLACRAHREVAVCK